MDETGKKFAGKMLEDSPEGVCKDIIFAYLGGSEIDQAIEKVLLGDEKPQKKPRKKRVRKEKPEDSGTVLVPKAVLAPRKRKSLEDKCKEMEANYPDLYAQAMTNSGYKQIAGLPMSNKARKLILTEFTRLFKDQK